MTLSLTCACGARLDVDDVFAGKTITCPDCQQPLQAVATDQARLRTSGFALASLILALLGAFTVLGTLAAVALGAVGLAQIRKHPDRLAGKGFALAGIVLGVLFTGGTLFALSTFEFFGLSSIIGQAQWAGKLDHGGPLEIVRENEGYAIKRPSDRWGVYRPQQGKDPTDLSARGWDELLLVHPGEEAVVYCQAQAGKAHVGMVNTLEECLKNALRDFDETDRPLLFGKSIKGQRGQRATVISTKHPEPVNGTEMMEALLEKKIGSQDRMFLLRVVRREGDNVMYLVIGGARKSHFNRVERQLREVLDSFRILNLRGNDR